MAMDKSSFDRAGEPFLGGGGDEAPGKPQIVYAAVAHHLDDGNVRISTHCYVENDERAHKMHMPKVVEKACDSMLQNPAPKANPKLSYMNLSLFEVDKKSRYKYLIAQNRDRDDCKGVAVAVAFEKTYHTTDAFKFAEAVYEDNDLSRVVFNVEASRTLREEKLRKLGNVFNEKPPSMQGKRAQVQDAIDSTKELLVENIEVAIGRHEAIEILKEETEDLAQMSQEFQRGSKKLKNKFWWANKKWCMAITLFIIIIIVILLLIFCHPNFSECKSSDKK